MRFHVMLTTAFTVAALVLAAGATLEPAHAGSDTESAPAAAERLRAATGGNLSIRYAAATQVARFVRATGDAALPTATGGLEEKAYAFLGDYGALFGVRDARTELATAGTTTDDAGSVLTLAQRNSGLPVFNAELLVHFDGAGSITSVNGTFVPGIKVSTTPRVSADSAAAQAVSAVSAARPARLTQPWHTPVRGRRP